MNIPVFLSVFSVLGIIYLVLGLLASRKIKSNEDFFLAGRGLGVTALTFTLIATHLGGGMMIGTSQEAYQVGFYGILYNLGICLGFIVLGFGFAAKLRSFNVSTTVELLEVKYGSRILRKVASVISALALGGILVGQVVTSKSIFLALGIQNEWVIVLFWLFMIIYTMLGGLKAVVVTDIAQVLFIVVLFITVFIVSFVGDLAVSIPQNMMASKSLFSGDLISFSRLFGFFFLPLLLSFIEQDLAQRFFAAKTKFVATISAFVAGFFILFFSFIPVYFGMKAKMLGLSVVAGASPLVVVLQKTMGDIVVALVVCGLFAAVISTADSLLCAAGSNIAQDFDFSFISKNRLLTSKVIIFIIGGFALIGGYFFNQVLEVFKHSYELLIATLFVSIFACFFNKRVYQQAAYASVAFGLIAFVWFRIFPVNFMPREVVSLAFSTLGYFIGVLYAVRNKQNKMGTEYK